MTATFTGNSPVVLDPMHTSSTSADFDPHQRMREVMIDPFFEPAGSTDVTLDIDGEDVDADALQQIMLDTLGDTVDTDAVETIREVHQAGMKHFDASANVLSEETFVVQAGARAGLPGVSDRVIYAASSDIIPAAKEMIAGTAKAEDTFFTSIGYAFGPKTLGFWFTDEKAFEDFKEHLAGVIDSIKSGLDANTRQTFRKFADLTLDKLTESIMLRADITDGNQPNSFPRVLANVLMRYQSSSDEAGMMPFSVSELFIPTSMVFINVDKHASSSGLKVNKEWRMIKDSLLMPVDVVSIKELTKLTAIHRAAQSALSEAAAGRLRRDSPAGRAMEISFRAKPPSTLIIQKKVLRLLKIMKHLSGNMNTYRMVTKTFSRPNRRQPDNPDRPGRGRRVEYFPDIHVFLDNSISVSQDQYQDSIIMLIRMAKALKVDLWFSSFADNVSQPVVLRTKGKSVAKLWKMFLAIPKVNGGTDFEPVWEFINASPKRRARLNLMITDFGYYPPNDRVGHPKNLYYVPLSNIDWDSITYWAESFSKRMTHIDPNIHQKMLGVYA